MVSFWDTSALAALLVREADSGIRETELLTGGVIVVWWGTRVELQLAAALLACREHTNKAAFHCSDKRLCDAAEREGFRVFAGKR